MSAKFYTLLTDIGAAKLASAAALGVPLKITQMAVGDGGGVLPTPSAQQTALVAEKRRAALNMLYIDPQNSSQIIAEQVIPETEGGWWIREVGLFDETGALIAVGNCPESYKPQLAEGSGRTQTVRMVLITSSTENITLKIDPSVVLATRGYVDNLNETRQQKSDTLTALAELKPTKGKLPYFTAEKSAALADLSDFIRLMLGKVDAAAVLEYLGLGAGAPAIGVPFFWPSAAMPNTVMPEWSNMIFLKFNGSTFSATEYPKLARVIPSLKLTEARSEFPRIWDDGRGVDSGRILLSAQGDAIRNIEGTFKILTNNSGAGMMSSPTGAFEPFGNSLGPVVQSSSDDTRKEGARFSADLVVPTAAENRPRNIAFNFLVRAK